MQNYRDKTDHDDWKIVADVIRDNGQRLRCDNPTKGEVSVWSVIVELVGLDRRLWDAITTSIIADRSGIARNHVSTAINLLKDRKVIYWWPADPKWGPKGKSVVSFVPLTRRDGVLTYRSAVGTSRGPETSAPQGRVTSPRTSPPQGETTEATEGATTAARLEGEPLREVTDLQPTGTIRHGMKVWHVALLMWAKKHGIPYVPRVSPWNLGTDFVATIIPDEEQWLIEGNMF